MIIIYLYIFAMVSIKLMPNLNKIGRNKKLKQTKILKRITNLGQKKTSRMERKMERRRRRKKNDI